MNDAAKTREVEQAVESLRKAMVDADRARLMDFAADELSYGHSSGLFETKAVFVEAIAGGKNIFKSLSLSDLSTRVVGDIAIARHIFAAEVVNDGKPNSVRIGILQVWTRRSGGWKLLARQAFKQ